MLNIANLGIDVVSRPNPKGSGYENQARLRGLEVRCTHLRQQIALRGGDRFLVWEGPIPFGGERRSAIGIFGSSMVAMFLLYNMHAPSTLSPAVWEFPHFARIGGGESTNLPLAALN